MPNFMDDKYRSRGKVQDFVSDLIDSQCYVEDTNGKNRRLDIDTLFGLAANNGIDTTNLEKHRDTPNGVGRIRMTLANMLRSRARKRHGLYDVEGNVVDAPKDFIGDSPRVESLDGERLREAKPETQSEDAEAGGDEAAA